MARAATNPRERLCDTRRKQKAHKSMQHIMGNVNSMRGGKSGNRGKTLGNGEASQGETKLITRRGNVITKIFSPSSAACQGNKMPFVKRCPTEQISSGQAQGKSLMSFMSVRECVCVEAILCHFLNLMIYEPRQLIKLIKISLNFGAVQQRLIFKCLRYRFLGLTIPTISHFSYLLTLSFDICACHMHINSAQRELFRTACGKKFSLWPTYSRGRNDAVFL